MTMIFIYDHHHHDLFPLSIPPAPLWGARGLREMSDPRRFSTPFIKVWFKIQFYISGPICSDIQMFADFFKTLVEIITRKKFEDCWIEMAEPRREPALKDWKVKSQIFDELLFSVCKTFCWAFEMKPFISLLSFCRFFFPPGPDENTKQGHIVKVSRYLPFWKC